MADSSTNLRPSGYVGRLQELGYGLTSPLYDLFVAWAMLPIGGEAKVRTAIASWLEAEDGDAVLSLCSGTGTTDRALLRLVPGVRLTGVDLGRGQLARAQAKDVTGTIEYLRRNATDTELEAGSFDRTMIVGALHEMPRESRARVLAEAHRLTKEGGHLLAFEPCRTQSRRASVMRSLVLFLWLPGNPETRTTYDLIDHGLETELREAGFEPVSIHRTEPDWFEGILARRL